MFLVAFISISGKGMLLVAVKSQVDTARIKKCFYPRTNKKIPRFVYQVEMATLLNWGKRNDSLIWDCTEAGLTSEGGDDMDAGAAGQYGLDLLLQGRPRWRRRQRRWRRRQ
jgi:hypothetical protein